MTGMSKETLSKRAFIRSVPDLPAADVVEEGRKRGIQFSVGYVYVTRSNQKSRADEVDAKVLKRLEKVVARVFAKAQCEMLAEIKRSL